MKIRRIRFKDIEQVPQIRIRQDFKQDFFGSAPAPFIGRFGYPNVNIGLLSPQEITDTLPYDSPRLWSRQNFPLSRIASLRYDLVNSRSKSNVKDVLKEDKFLSLCQEAGMARQGVEVEISLKRLPQLSWAPEKEIIPFGPGSEIRKARLTANPQIDSRVEKVVSDTDLKSLPALLSLYRQGFEENFLSKLVSVGNLGLKRNRKLVPTRWSITAVDDAIGRQLIKEIKDFPAGDFQCHFGGGWGNYYLVFFFPPAWSYELFETYLGHQVNPWSQQGNFYSTDYESYEGRKSYAEETAGGYYAARSSILEKMKENQRQQSALVLRFITSEYALPLGVWVCREAARKALREKPLVFASPELMLAYGRELIRNRFGFDLGCLLKESRLLKEKKEQKRLFEF